MRCDTCRELFDDHEQGRLAGSLQSEVAEHLGGCPTCSHALGLHRGVVGALGSLPAPVLPADFENNLMRRLRAIPKPSPLAGALAFLREAWPIAVRYLAVGATAAGIAVAVYAYRAHAPVETPSPAAVQPAGQVATAPDVRVPALPDTRVCNAADPTGALVVQKGEDVAVTLSVQTPEPMGGAKVYVVLPRGLTFSPVDHPDLADSRVLTFIKDIDEGSQDFGFTVRGEKSGKWDVTALVEQGDQVLLAGTTIDVAPEEELP